MLWLTLTVSSISLWQNMEGNKLLHIWIVRTFVCMMSWCYMRRRIR